MWKRRSADERMSKFVRIRDQGLCQYNFMCFPGTPGDQNSHFQKRRKESVRFEPDNCDWVCYLCHDFVERHPRGPRRLEEFKLLQLGQKRYNDLIFKGNNGRGKPDKQNMEDIKKLIKDLNDSSNL